MRSRLAAARCVSDGRRVWLALAAGKNVID
jgi:hypothetical protein